MFATKLKVASALFLSFFIIWLVLILLVAQPTDNVGQIQFSNLALLASFLGSATVASLSSMVIGLHLLEFKMKPIGIITKKLGRGRVNLRARKSAVASPKQQKKDSTVQPEKLQTSQIKLEADTPSLEEEYVILPALSLPVGEEGLIENLNESDKAAEEDIAQLKANTLSQPPKITTHQEPSFERETPTTVLKRDDEDDSTRISCPKCSKVFTLALLSLDFGKSKTKIVRSCPHCYAPLESFEDKKTRSAKIADDRKPRKRNQDELKAFFLFGETEFKGCKFKVGYLGSLPKNIPIPDECFGCPKLVECFQALKTSQ